MFCRKKIAVKVIFETMSMFKTTFLYQPGESMCITIIEPVFENVVTCTWKEYLAISTHDPHLIQKNDAWRKITNFLRTKIYASCRLSNIICAMRKNMYILGYSIFFTLNTHKYMCISTFFTPKICTRIPLWIGKCNFFQCAQTNFVIKKNIL